VIVKAFVWGHAASPSRGQVDPKIAEIMAALHAMIFRKEAGFMEFIF
jgi:hypothetical protein